MKERELKKKNLAKANAREHDKAEKKGNLEKVERPLEKQSQISSNIKEIDKYNVGLAKGENADLLAFKAGASDEDIDARP